MTNNKVSLRDIGREHAEDEARRMATSITAELKVDIEMGLRLGTLNRLRYVLSSSLTSTQKVNRMVEIFDELDKDVQRIHTQPVVVSA